MNFIGDFEIDNFNQYGIKPNATTSTCPKCSSDRKYNPNQKCLSVFWDTGLGKCNHCGELIQLHTYKKKNITKVYKTPKITPKILATESDVVKFCKDTRGISESVLKRFKIGESIRWMPKAGKEIKVIEFPYFVLDKLVNVKYRGKDKDFMFEQGFELVMYNLDAIKDEKECVIVEGEFDALAFTQAGYNSVTSVPNGFTVPPKGKSESVVNLSFLDDYYAFFENKEKIILAVDNDKAGLNGRKELIRRFGSDKCWIVDFKDCKDANDYLLKYGESGLLKVIENATQIPIENVETLKDFENELVDFWLNGSPKGHTCGVSNLDRNYSIDFGQYCVITGPPQSGKSDFVDSITVGYSLIYDYKIAYASPENKPNKYHASKIIKKIIGFVPENEVHVLSDSVTRARSFYNDHYYHVTYDSGYELRTILDKFIELVHRKGVRVFVIDPFNKVKLKCANGKNVNDYTNDYLNEIDIFCKKYECIVYLVAHPVKMAQEDGTQTYKMPTAYDVKGGGEIFDMSYHIIGIVKDIERKLVKVKTLKVKFQHLGSPDIQFWFKWNARNGRYISVDYDESLNHEPEFQWDNSDWLEPKGLSKNQIREDDQIIDLDSGLVFSSNPLDLAAKRIHSSDTPPF